MTAQSQILPIHTSDRALVNPTPRQMSKRILLVDNQAHVLRVMKSTLDRCGYEVETAMSADNALTILRESCFDVLIIDNGLEKLDGQQLIYTIDDQYHGRVPAMFLLTDKDAENLQQWCLQFDRTECIKKPISISYLDDRLNELFGVRSAGTK